jgi:hypothetical protein
MSFVLYEEYPNVIRIGVIRIGVNVTVGSEEKLRLHRPQGHNLRNLSSTGVCVCVCVRARARVCACVRVCVHPVSGFS